jgi:hypothetical protein
MKMNRVKSITLALAMTLALSSTTLAGNIGGMRLQSAGNIGGMRTQSTGNIGGMKADSTGNIGGMKADSTGNIGGLRTNTGFSVDLSVAIAGNIGGLLRILFSSVSIF